MSILSGPELSPASGNAPENLVVLLHGYGANGKDLMALAEHFAKDMPGTQFLLPDAPHDCEANPGGKQWFSLAKPDPELMIAGAKDVANTLNDYLNECLQTYGLSDDKMALVGFSQGTMLAIHVGLRREKPCAGIVGYSGMLLGDEKLPSEITSRPPISLIHGEDDEVISPAAMPLAIKILEECGLEIAGHLRPGLAHGVDEEGVTLGMAFLKEKMAA